MANTCRHKKVHNPARFSRWKPWLMKNRRPILIALSLVVLFLTVVWCVLELMEVSRTDDTVRAFLNNIACDNCFPLDLQVAGEMNDRDSLCNFHSSDTAVVLLIFSKSQNQLQRHLIRHTWGSVANTYYHHIRIFFVFGHIQDASSRRILRQENEKHRDIVIGNFKDSYYNLTLKAIFALNWALMNCPDARYIMKTDDDVAINVPNVLATIRQHDLRDTIAGDCIGPMGPVRSKSSKWYADEEKYPLAYYPMFCSGPGYVMPVKVARDVVTISKTIPFFHLEDVYIGFCIAKLGYKRKSLYPFHRIRKLSILELDYYCSCVATSHQLSATEILSLWRGSQKRADCRLRSVFYCETYHVRHYILPSLIIIFALIILALVFIKFKPRFAFLRRFRS